MSLQVERTHAKSLIGDSLTAVDVGARGDIPKHWLVLDGLANFECFDADVEACEKLSQTYASRGHGERYRVHPVALARANGTRTLYLTRGRGGTSLLKPDTDVVRRHHNADYVDIERTIEIETRHAGDYFREAGLTDIDLIKIDVEGCEMEILSTLGDQVMDKLVAVEIEVQVHDRDNGAPVFGEMNSFLTARGFELIDLQLYRHHPTSRGSRAETLDGFGIYERSPSIARQVAFGDAFYARRSCSSTLKMRNVVTALCAYGFFSCAKAHVLRARDAAEIEPTEAAEMIEHVLAWHACRKRWWDRPRLAEMLDRLGLVAQTRAYWAG